MTKKAARARVRRCVVGEESGSVAGGSGSPLEQDVPGRLVAAAAGFGLGEVGRERRAVQHFGQHHHLRTIGVIAERGAVDQELAAGRRMVELPDPAARLHGRVQRRVVALGHVDRADQLAGIVELPLRQRIAVDEVEMAAVLITPHSSPYSARNPGCAAR